MIVVDTVSDLGECSAVDENNNEAAAAIALPDVATGVVDLDPTISEWVFMGVILALCVGMAVLWIEYKRLKKDKRTMRNLLSQGWCTSFL